MRGMKSFSVLAFLLSCLGLFMLPVVSAFYQPSLYWLRPEYFFNSPWFRWGLAFIFFYAIVFFGAKRAFRENNAVATAVAFVLAMIISYALWARGYLNFYFSSDLLDWAIVLAFLLVFAIFIRFLYTRASRFGSILALIAGWAALFMLYTSNAIPFYSLPEGVKIFFELATGMPGIIAVMLTALILALRPDDEHRRGRHGHRDYSHLHDRP